VTGKYRGGAYPHRRANRSPAYLEDLGHFGNEPLGCGAFAEEVAGKATHIFCSRRRPMEERAIVQCSNCNTPGAVVFENGEIKKAFFPCKCPRPSVKDANKEITAKSPAFQEGTRPSP
jgi:hypothetical protein